MARPLRISYPGAFYHITARGNEKKNIFRDGRDRKKFLGYLESAASRYGARIHAYCLMDNHFHILLETPNANLPQIMHHIAGAYTTYFNIRHQRSGHLLQGRYKSILVEKDEYASELSCYIHLNPVRADLVDRPEKYLWSSYPFFIGLKKAPHWLAMGFILGHFGKKVRMAQRRYHRFVLGRLGQKYKNPLDDVVSSAILGGTDFLGFIKDKYLKKREYDPNIPALRALAEQPSIGKIIDAVKATLGGNRPLARGVELYLCRKHTRKKLMEIGEVFGIGESGVSQASRRIAMRIPRDHELEKIIGNLEGQLNLSKMKT